MLGVLQSPVETFAGEGKSASRRQAGSLAACRRACEGLPEPNSVLGSPEQGQAGAPTQQRVSHRMSYRMELALPGSAPGQAEAGLSSSSVELLAPQRTKPQAGCPTQRQRPAGPQLGAGNQGYRVSCQLLALWPVPC